jgi:hypothetical protein
MFTCPRCGGRKIKQVRYATWDAPLGAKMVAEWKCLGCGEASHNPAQACDPSRTLDLTVGCAILLSLVTSVVTALACLM